jgi:folate-binding protein YgfZ
MNLPEWTGDTRLHRLTGEDFGFGEILAEATAVLQGDVVALPQQPAVIRVGGADADTFLQGQLSNDIRALGAGQAQLNSWNSAKGRVLTVLLGLRRGDGILLELPHSLLAKTLQRLRMYVLRARVDLNDAGENWRMLGVAGPTAAAALSAAGLPVPAADWDCAQTDDVIVMRRPGPRPRYSIHGAVARLAPLWEQFQTQRQPVGSAAWRLLDVLAGLPAIHPSTQDEFIAQMLNLDRLGGISFNKGCYTGQEIVARLHYLGNLKRRMFLGYVAERAPQPGEPIVQAGSDQPVGAVVDAAPHPQRGYATLAVLTLTAATGTALHLGGPQGPGLQLEPGQADGG